MDDERVIINTRVKRKTREIFNSVAKECKTSRSRLLDTLAIMLDGGLINISNEDFKTRRES